MLPVFVKMISPFFNVPLLLIAAAFVESILIVVLFTNVPAVIVNAVAVPEMNFNPEVLIAPAMFKVNGVIFKPLVSQFESLRVAYAVPLNVIGIDLLHPPMLSTPADIVD